MKNKAYSVYDSASEMHSPPFFVNHENVAIRYFTQAINDPAHQYGAHPADYTLFDIGEWCDQTSTFTQDKIVSLGNGLQFKTKQETE